jgi:hypothetical protein
MDADAYAAEVRQFRDAARHELADLQADREWPRWQFQAERARRDGTPVPKTIAETLIRADVLALAAAEYEVVLARMRLLTRMDAANRLPEGHPDRLSLRDLAELTGRDRAPVRRQLLAWRAGRWPITESRR